MFQRRQSRLAPRVVHMTSAHSAFDSRIFYKECVSLSRAGYDVIELTNQPENAVRNGVQVRGLGRSRSRVHRVLKSCNMLRTALRLDGDVYHFHDPELLVCGVLLRLCGKSVIYDIHEDLPRTLSYKRYIPAAIRPVAAIVIEVLEDLAAACMSGLVAATPTIAKRFQWLNRHTCVVSNFPLKDELVTETRVEWQARENAVAYIGGIAEERGIRELLSAIAQCSSSPAPELHLAGRWTDEALQQELQQRIAWQRVRWHGMLDRVGVRDLLSRVRVGLVVLHPERNFVVSQPIKLFEYMAAGIPVIASDFPLWRQIIGGAGCGLLVDPAKSQEIASAIDYLLTHPREAEAMGHRGRLAIEERFNWRHEEATLLGLYRKLIGAAAPAMAIEGSRAEA